MDYPLELEKCLDSLPISRGQYRENDERKAARALKSITVKSKGLPRRCASKHRNNRRESAGWQLERLTRGEMYRTAGCPSEVIRTKNHLGRVKPNQTG